MLCPLIKDTCVLQKCSWYDNGNKCCAVLGILIEKVKGTEAIQDSSLKRSDTATGRGDVRVSVNPVVEVREIIKTILPSMTHKQEDKHEHTASSVPDKASELLSPITWFQPSKEGNEARVGTTDNARAESQDVGDNAQGNDGNWGKDVPGQDIAIPTDVYGLG